MYCSFFQSELFFCVFKNRFELLAISKSPFNEIVYIEIFKFSTAPMSRAKLEYQFAFFATGEIINTTVFCRPRCEHRFQSCIVCKKNKEIVPKENGQILLARKGQFQDAYQSFTPSRFGFSPQI